MELLEPEQEQEQLSQDNLVAAHLFDCIERMSADVAHGLSVWQKAAGKFNGEVILSAARPSGGLYIILADFTGRDLITAVGALSLAELFYSMTKEGYALNEIVDKINKKLCFVLPKYLSCAACVVELDDSGQILAVWNGGMPDLLVVSTDGHIKYRMPSKHIRLGKRELRTKDLEMVFVNVVEGDRVVFHSKGVVSSANVELDTGFSLQELENLLCQGVEFSDIHAEISRHMADMLQLEDVTFAEFHVAVMQEYAEDTSTEASQDKLPPTLWQVDFEFAADVLHQVELAPLLVNILMQIQAPHEHRQRIYTVLAEMCSNALDHGVLELESSMKNNTNGFAEYYALRRQRLQRLKEGFIHISLSHRPYKKGGQFTIRIEDSGKGFDFQQHQKDLAENKAFAGRGGLMLQQLCDEYYYSGEGNVCHAIYNWNYS